MASQPSVATSACRWRRSPAFSMAAAIRGLSSTMSSFTSLFMSFIFPPLPIQASSTFVSQDLSHPCEKHIIFHGFADEVGRADLERFDLHFFSRHAGDEDRRNLQTIFATRLQKPATV